MDKISEQAASNAMTIGPSVLAPQGLLFRRPIDVVRAPALSPDAAAISVNLTVVTRNVQDFDDTGVIVIDPWQD